MIPIVEVQSFDHKTPVRTHTRACAEGTHGTGHIKSKITPSAPFDWRVVGLAGAAIATRVSRSLGRNKTNITCVVYVMNQQSSAISNACAPLFVKHKTHWLREIPMLAFNWLADHSLSRRPSLQCMRVCVARHSDRTTLWKYKIHYGFFLFSKTLGNSEGLNMRAFGNYNN